MIFFITIDNKLYLLSINEKKRIKLNIIIFIIYSSYF